MAQDSARPDFWDVRYRDGVTPWDAGGAPERFVRYLSELAPGARVLVPGCGAAYEVALLAEASFDVLAIDFSAAAVAEAKRHLGTFADRVVEADFFAFDAGPGFDVVYERAFLCALPRPLWDRYAERAAELVRPGGEIAGYWFYDDNLRGPPFGLSPARQEALLAPHFTRESDEPVSDSIPVFAGRERWQRWRRRAGAPAAATGTGSAPSSP